MAPSGVWCPPGGLERYSAWRRWSGAKQYHVQGRVALEDFYTTLDEGFEEMTC